MLNGRQHKAIRTVAMHSKTITFHDGFVRMRITFFDLAERGAKDAGWLYKTITGVTKILSSLKN